MSECQPCKNRQQKLNEFVPGLGDLIAGIIHRTLISRWFLTAYIWIYGETPGERATRLFEPTAVWIDREISDSYCKWQYENEDDKCYFQGSEMRGGVKMCSTHAREYDDIHAQIEEE